MVKVLQSTDAAVDQIAAALQELGGIVDDIACYRTVPESEDRTQAAAKLIESGADWLTFSSSSTVENFHARFDLPKLLKQFPKMRVLSIGPETSSAIRKLGLAPSVEAKEHNIDGMVKALLQAGQPARK